MLGSVAQMKCDTGQCETLIYSHWLSRYPG